MHHNIVNDMMKTQEMTYRPQHGTDGVPNDSQVMLAIVGFDCSKFSYSLVLIVCHFVIRCLLL